MASAFQLPGILPAALGPGGAGSITLGALTLSGSLQIGTAASGTIIGATAGSTITGNIPGITINSGARTYSGTPTGSSGTISNGLVETLAGATNTPNNSAVTVAAAALSAPTAIATMTQFPMSGTPFQKDVYTGGLAGKGTGLYPVAFSAVTTAGTINARFSSGGGTRGDLIPAWQAATIGSTGAQTVPVRADCLGQQWGYVDIGTSDGAGGTTWQNGTTLVALGRLAYANGQSLLTDQVFKSGTSFAAAGLTSVEQTAAANWCRILATCETYHINDVTGVVWEAPAASHYPGCGVAAHLAQWAIQTGDIVGFASHSISGSELAAFQPSNTSSTILIQAQRVFDLGGAKYEAMDLHQGQGDSTAGVPYKFRKQDLNLRMFGVFSGQGSPGSGGWADRNTFTTGGLTSRTGAVRWTSCSINNMSIGPYYYGFQVWQNDIRRADIEVMAATPNGVYLHEYGLDLTGSGVHPPNTVDGQVKLGRGFARCKTRDTAGPVLTAATRDPSNPNSIILTWDRAVVLTGNWYERLVAYFAGSTLNFAPFSSGNQTSLPSNQARAIFNTSTWTPTDGDAFDVMQGACGDGDPNADESGNMIRDASDPEGYGFGRSFQASLVPVTAAAINGAIPVTPNGSMPRTYVAPASLWDVPMTSPVYAATEYLTGFGRPLIGGKGTTATLNNFGQAQKCVSNCIGQTLTLRFRWPTVTPPATVIMFGVNGMQFVADTANKVRGLGSTQTALSAALVAGHDYWAALIPTPAGVQLYVCDVTTPTQPKLTTTAAITRAYSIVNGNIDVADAGGVNAFLAIGGGALYEAALYDTVMFTGASNSFTIPSTPVAVGDAHLIGFWKLTFDSDVSGVQPDLVRVL